MNLHTLLGRTAFALAGLLLLAGTTRADLVTITYQIDGTNFLDSANNPPPGAGSTSVSGTYTFVFDNEIFLNGIVPDEVVGMDVTKPSGAVTDYDETNSGIDADVNKFTKLADFTVGGTASSIAFMVGGSNDFRVRFRISLVDYSVLSVLEALTYVTDETGFYSAQTTTITLVSATVSYCTAGTSASGCQAMLTTAGVPSASAASGFTLDTATVEGNKDGLYFFGTNGRQANPWGNGTSFQCVVPPVKRAGLLTGIGTNGACDGAFSQDFNTLWNTFPAKNPGAGAVVQAQLWYRDPFNTSNQTTSLSNAVEFTLDP